VDDPHVQRRLVQSLAASLSSDAHAVTVLETHISYVLLTGTYAYKIKKAVKLPFLDFSTLPLRKEYCDEELRLNVRLAPKLYLDVVPITGPARRPSIAGGGPVLDYAVRMGEFAQEALLSKIIDRNDLAASEVDALACNVADFHARAAPATAAAAWGTPESILSLALANFDEIMPLVHDQAARDALHRLNLWTQEEYRQVHAVLERRRHAGAIRECHGDLHLGNIARIDGDLTVFDCIEFNPSMRWIDTMSEVAFTMMDVERHGRADLAYRYLSSYLERTGDFAGGEVLRFYLVYRTMVRAKVACLRAAQSPLPDARGVPDDEFNAHLLLAASYVEARHPAIVVMHGYSGSGKTTLSQALLERTPAVRIRTDVERKRLAGLRANAQSGSEVAGGLYGKDVTQRTYARVLACTQALVRGGFTAIVDGAFLQRWQRDLFRDLAANSNVPFLIVDCLAPQDTLKARLAARATAGKDASEADATVLEHQLRTSDELGPDELPSTLAFHLDASAALAARASSMVVDRILTPENGAAAASEPPSPVARADEP
jgi:aminoglycoside phosphotransferase family enzyme/predicted kinase